MKQYREAVEGQIKQEAENMGFLVRNVDFEVEEDMDSEKFGRLQWLLVTVSEENDQSGTAAELKKSLTSQLGLSGSQVRIEVE